MCALSTDGRATIYACEATDEDGLAYLNIPPGVEVQVRNGCPVEEDDWVETCVKNDDDDTAEGGYKIGRDIVVYTEGDADSDDDRTLTISADETESSSTLYFKERTSRYLSVYYAAGRYNSTESTSDDHDAWAEGFTFSTAVLLNTEFNLTDTSGGGKCDALVQVADAASSSDGSKVFLVDLPRDIEYDISPLVDAAALFTAGVSNDTATYLNSIPTTTVLEDDLDPSVEFMLRVTPTVEIHLADSGYTTVGSCTDSDGENIYGVPMLDGLDELNPLYVSFFVTEFYNASLGAISSDTDQYVYTVQGNIVTTDGLSRSKQSRKSASGALLDNADANGDYTGTLTSCTRATGCDLPYIITCKPSDDCATNQMTFEGTAYQMAIR